MSSSIFQNPTFSCQQLVMKYCHGGSKFGWKITPSLQHCKPITMLSQHLVLVTLHRRGLQFLLSKTITGPFRRIYRIFLDFIEENRKMGATCKPVDLETLGSWPIRPKNLPRHCDESRLPTCIFSLIARLTSVPGVMRDFYAMARGRCDFSRGSTCSPT